jgi:hypothetical protein
MYGLLGSMIISFMMISVKKCQGEIVSVLNSEMAQHIEKALMKIGFAYSRHGVENLKDVSINISSNYSGTEGMQEVMQEETSENNSDNNQLIQVSNKNEKQILEQELINANNSSTKEEIRVLKRLEIRMAEFIKNQEKGMNAEMTDFQKQRSDMLRSLTENTESSNQFRTELQRVGRQLGGILILMEKGNDDIRNEIRELIVRLADDAAETHRLLSLMSTPPKE